MPPAYQILFAVLTGRNIAFKAPTEELAQAMLEEARRQYWFLLQVLKN